MLRCWCGSMAEQLICNQQVVGSTPITSSKASHQVKPKYKGDFPSGQRGQTVNLLSLTSVVRIHHPPPTKNALLSTKTKVRFLNDVCLRQMMTATPNDVRYANDVCLAAHWANIASLRVKRATSYLQSKCIISLQGDTSFLKCKAMP